MRSLVIIFFVVVVKRSINSKIIIEKNWWFNAKKKSSDIFMSLSINYFLEDNNLGTYYIMIVGNRGSNKM